MIAQLKLNEISEVRELIKSGGKLSSDGSIFIYERFGRETRAKNFWSFTKVFIQH
jgi:hypothetical protein